MESRGLFLRRSIYVAAFVLSLVFISFRGGSLPYMLFFMVAVNTAVSIAYIFYVFFTVKVYQTVPERKVVKGSLVPYSVKLSNEGLLAYSVVGLRFIGTLSEVRHTEGLADMSMEPGGEFAFQTELLCRYSGTYDVGVDTIEIMDYFRIFRIRFPMPEKLKVTVKPRILELADIAFITEEESRNSGQRGISDCLVDNEVHRYVPGDNRRLIHWKNSAKRRELMVRTLTAEELPEYVVFMDGNVEAADHIGKVMLCDRLREAAVALVNYIYRSGYYVLAVLGEADGQDILSRREFDAFYDRVTEYGFSGRMREMGALLEEWNRGVRAGVPFIVVTAYSEALSVGTREAVGCSRSLHILDVRERLDFLD